MYAVKLTLLLLATASSLSLVRVKAEEEEVENLLDLVGLFQSTYDYAGRAFDSKQQDVFDGEDQPLLDMAQDMMIAEEEEEEAKNRVVTTTLTGDQIAGALVAATLESIRNFKWDISKRFQKQYTDVPYNAGGSTRQMRLEVREGFITGLGTLRRESAVLNKNTNEISLRMGLESVYMDADFTVRVPGVGAAPANTARGHVRAKLSHAWMDAVARLDDNGIPVNIKSFISAGVDPIVIQATNLGGNNYGPVYRSAFGEALRQITLKMLRTNIRVRFNQGLQKIKEAGNYNGYL